jgi:hypothetical protein
MKLLGLFWASFVSIGGLITAYVQVESIGYGWTFWLALPLAVLATAGLWYAATGVTAIKRMRDYPALEQRYGSLDSDLQAANGRIAELRTQVHSAREAGITEGQQRVFGSVLSINATIPELLAVVDYGGDVALLCRPGEDPPPEGARFFVVSKTSGNVRGVVQVDLHDPDKDLLYLRVVDASVPRFWSTIAERIEYDETLPPDIALKSYKFAEHQAATSGATAGDPQPEPIPEEN